MQSPQKIKVLNLVIASIVVLSEPAMAGQIEEWLSSFLLKDATEVISKFGAADISTPHQLRYLFNSSPEPFGNGMPAPVNSFDGYIHSPGGSRGGVALQSPKLENQQLPCLIEFDIDASSIVQHTRFSGPGCYEIVYSRTNRE